MKRTLSLILALAMIMSLFTTVSFAAVGDSENPIAASGMTATIKPGEPTTILKDGKTTLKKGTLSGAPSGTKYFWKSSDTDVATVSGDVVSAKSNGSADFYLWAQVGDGDSATYYKSTASVTITVDTKSSKDFEWTATVEGAKTAIKLTVGNTATAPEFKLYPKAGGEAVSGTYTYKSDKTAVATVTSAGVIEAVKEGTAKITREITYGGVTFTKQVATVTVGSSNLTKEITNGSEVSYTGKTLKKEIADKIKSATGSSVDIDKLELTYPDSLGRFTVYETKVNKDNKIAAGATKDSTSDTYKLIVVPTAGYVGTTLAVEYSVNNGDYTGTITFKSEYDDEVTDEQKALFHEEAFYLNKISGIDELSTTKNKTTPGGVEKYYEDSDFLVDPDGASDEWDVEYTGYDDGVAKEVTVTFTPVDYDILVYGEDGSKPFTMDMFESFADAVRSEQDEYYAIDIEHVKFPTVSGSKWTLEEDGSKIKSSDKFTATTLEDVSIDVSAAGYYDIPFEVYFEYKTTKSASWSSSSDHYEGLVRVYAASKGDIKYEVAYGETVKFDSDDFEALYKKQAGSSKKLSSLTVDILPVYGTLYRNAKLTSTYEVDVDDVFYVSPTSANDGYDIDDLTYWAPTAYTEDYSVYVAVTMSGTGGSETAVVEIVINGAIPFTDVAKGSTFYEYIRYCYNKNIMGGKTATKFDASSSVTRAQLVTTLYRMAGSPTTHNSKTLPFTDTTTLSTEFSNAVKWAYYNKMVGGTSATTFAPYNAVTRQALVKILYGYAKAYGMDVGVIYNGHLGSYTDGASVSADMQTAMNWALDYGLLSGNGAKLNPRGSTSRGAAAKILANFHSNFVG